MSRFLTQVRRHPLLRRGLRPLRGLYYGRTFFYPPPKLLANSMPKAGTNLLSRLLNLMPRVAYSGIHAALDAFHLEEANLNWDDVSSRLSHVRDGQFATGHFPALPDFLALIERLGLRTVNIFRDPRDMAVSHVFYVLDRPQHHLHRRFRHDFTSFQQRLSATISGFPADDLGPGMPSIAERLNAYRGWGAVEGAYVVRFEDLVGPRGGGNPDRQRGQIEDIGAFIDRPLSSRQRDRIAEKVWDPGAGTFRKGIIGDWRNHFNDTHRKEFKSTAGAHLVELGYERDLDW